MGRLKELYIECSAVERWREVETAALLTFPERQQLDRSVLEAIAALPPGTAISAEMEITPEGCVTAVLRQMRLGFDQDEFLPLLEMIAPSLAPGTRILMGRAASETTGWTAVVPEWITLTERSRGPKPFDHAAIEQFKIPKPPSAWPWDIKRALATLAASGGGSLKLTAKNLERDAQIIRAVTTLREELIATAYGMPDERILVAGQGHYRSMLDDPAMLGFEISIANNKLSSPLRNLVAMAMFGSLAGDSNEQVSDEDFRLIAGSRQIPDRLILCSEEIASLAGVGARRNFDNDQAWTIGSTTSGVAVSLSDADRARHVYVIGATGTGKSTLLKSLILQDAKAGEGIILLDPHGDLAEEIAEALPSERAEDLIYADAADLEGSFAVGLLPESSDSISFEIAADMLVNIFKNDLYSEVKEAFGPLFESYFRSALALLVAAEPLERHLANFPRIFEDREFRSRLLDSCGAPDVVSFWRKTALRTSGEIDLTNITPYITGKLTKFITTKNARAMFPDAKRCLNFSDVMENGKILILRCPKGALGEGLVELAMSACLMKIRAAAMAREATRVRRPVRLYIDEFQNCKGTSLQSLLAEGRKFGVSLVLANQSLGQIGGTTNRSVGAATLANVGNVVTFRLGATDALQLAPWLDAPERWRELCRLADFTMNARLLENGRPISLSSLRGPVPICHRVSDGLSHINQFVDG